MYLLSILYMLLELTLEKTVCFYFGWLLGNNFRSFKIFKVETHLCSLIILPHRLFCGSQGMAFNLENYSSPLFFRYAPWKINCHLTLYTYFDRRNRPSLNPVNNQLTRKAFVGICIHIHQNLKTVRQNWFIGLLTVLKKLSQCLLHTAIWFTLTTQHIRPCLVNCKFPQAIRSFVLFCWNDECSKNILSFWTMTRFSFRTSKFPSA